MRAHDIVWALAATIPLSAAGAIACAVLERAGASAKARERLFGLAFWLGPAASALALAADALPKPATARITVILQTTPLGAVSQASRVLAQAQAQVLGLHAPRPAEALLGNLPPLPVLLLAVIMLGAAFRLARLARAWLMLRSLGRGAGPAPAELARAARTAGLAASVPVRLSAAAPTPIAAGLLKPQVLLPARFAAPEAAELVALVLRHEAQHIGRRDNLRLALEQLAGALFWFDPARGALHRSLLAAREERCDAAALAGSAPAERRLYARTLLDELTRPVSPVLAVGLTGSGRSHAMTRVRAILDPQPANSRPMLALGLGALLAGAGGGMAYAANQAAEPLVDWASRAPAAVARTWPATAGPADVAPAVLALNEGAPPAAAKTIAAQAAPAVQTGGVVRNILVLGNHQVDVGTILSALPIARGQTVTPATLAAAEKALRDTGLFDDAGVTLRGGDLQVWVAERSPAVRPVFNDPDLQDRTVVSVDGAPVAETELRRRMRELAMARGVQVSPDNRIALEADALHSLFEERRQAREGRGGADQPAAPSAQLVSPSPPAAEPIAVTAAHADRFDDAQMTRFTGDVTLVGDLTRFFAQAPVQANSPWAPSAAHITRRLVADTVEVWTAPTGEIGAVIVNGLRFAE